MISVSRMFAKSCAALTMAILLGVLAAWPALDVVPAAQAETSSASMDPLVAARIKKLEAELRCLVCQAQSVADSDSEFSQDVRREINRMVEAGKTDEEIKDFLVQRYGDFILFRPPVKSTTALLWAGPLILLLIGVGTLGTILLRRRKSMPMALSETDHRKAEALLAAESGREKGEG